VSGLEENLEFGIDYERLAFSNSSMETIILELVRNLFVPSRHNLFLIRPASVFCREQNSHVPIEQCGYDEIRALVPLTELITSVSAVKGNDCVASHKLSKTRRLRNSLAICFGIYLLTSPCCSSFKSVLVSFCWCHWQLLPLANPSCFELCIKHLTKLVYDQLPSLKIQASGQMWLCPDCHLCHQEPQPLIMYYNAHTVLN
jgi:hypothetical protein